MKPSPKRKRKVKNKTSRHRHKGNALDGVAFITKLRDRIDRHFQAEAQILLDILRAPLSGDAIAGLIQFMEEHPYAKLTAGLLEPRKEDG